MHAMCINAFRKWKTSGKNQKIRDHDELLKENLNHSGIYNFCGYYDHILDTANILKQAEFCVGNDGGIQHLASAVDCPTVTIFTFTSIVKNAPWGKKAYFVCECCPHRIICQHKKWSECKNRICKNVPLEVVFNKCLLIMKEKNNENLLYL